MTNLKAPLEASDLQSLEDVTNAAYVNCSAGASLLLMSATSGALNMTVAT